MLTAERVRSILRLDNDTGDFFWLISPSPNVRVGSRAGWVKSDGRYKMMRIDGKCYYAHRVAWLFVHGEWPECEIDHVNGDGLDNRPCNIRKATRKDNIHNTRPRKNSSGFPGVSKYGNKWRATIRVDGKTRSLGYWYRPEDAHDAYVSASRLVKGEFSRL